MAFQRSFGHTKADGGHVVRGVIEYNPDPMSYTAYLKCNCGWEAYQTLSNVEVRDVLFSKGFQHCLDVKQKEDDELLAKDRAMDELSFRS